MPGTEGKRGSSRDDGASLKLHGNSGGVRAFQSVNGKDVTFNMKCLWRFCWAAGSNDIITRRAQYLSHMSEPPRVGSKTLNRFFKKMEGCTLMRDKGVSPSILLASLITLWFPSFLATTEDSCEVINPEEFNLLPHIQIQDSFFSNKHFYLGSKPNSCLDTEKRITWPWQIYLKLICNMRVFRNNRSVSLFILNSMHVYLLGQGES